MIGKGLKKGLMIFYIINAIIALLFFILSLTHFLIPEPSSSTLGSYFLLVLIKLPFYFSLIPLITFLMWNRLNSILVGIITVFWLVFLVFIFSFTFLAYIKTTDPNFDPCTIRPKADKDNCYSRKVIEELIKIKNNSGSISNIPAICQKMTAQEKISNCFDIYYDQEAQQDGNITLCEKISNLKEKDVCFYYVITQKIKNSSLCIKITDDVQRSGCIETVQRFRS